MYCILEETSEMRKVLSVWELPLVSSSWASSSLWKTLSKIQKKKTHTHTQKWRKTSEHEERALWAYK